MSFNETEDNSIRSFPCRNIDTRDIPAFAIVEVADYPSSYAGGDPNRFIAQEVIDQQVRWLVKRPTAATVEQRNPGRFAFVLRQPIKKNGGLGRITFELPCQVLHNGSEDGLPNGFECGPVADQFYVLSSDFGGFGFNCISHDQSQAAGSNTEGIHTVWVGPRREATGGHGKYSSPSTSVQPGERVYLSRLGIAKLEAGMEVENDIVRVSAPGLYLFGWQTCLSSQEDRGTILRLDVMQWTAAERDDNDAITSDGTESSTGFYGYREQEVEQDGYADDIRQGVENVACTGFVNLDEGEGVSIKNLRSQAVTIGGFQFWLVLARPFIREKPTGGLSYP